MSKLAPSGSRRRWTDEQLRTAVRDSASIAQVIRALGLVPAGGSYLTVGHHISVLGLDMSHFTGRAWVGTRPMRPGQRYTLGTIFCENSNFPTSRLLQVILREGYRERCCEGCGLSEWRERPIPLEVDHINGQNHDHRLENLRLLCPNCHALTPTWRGRKNKVARPPKAPKVPRISSVEDRQKRLDYQYAWLKNRRDPWVATNGPCSKCGSAKDLMVAYVDPAQATMRASVIWGRSAEIWAVELAKCHVICRVCYKAEQAAQRRSRGFKHGTRSMYQKHKCRCAECRGWNAADARRLRRKKVAW
jgi:hypothetical protein